MIHNDYGAPSGEEIQFYLIRDLLVSHGHEVKVYSRSSAEIPAMPMGNMRAFCAGIFNPWSRKRVSKLLEEFKPDIVLIKNLFPFISPAILPVIRHAGVPIVMCVANYRLMCPNGLHMSKGKTCENASAGANTTASSTTASRTSSRAPATRCGTRSPASRDSTSGTSRPTSAPPASSSSG